MEKLGIRVNDLMTQERHRGVRIPRVGTGRSLVLAGSSDFNERAHLLRRQFRLNGDSKQGGE
jgi:hypothetical protein